MISKSSIFTIEVQLFETDIGIFQTDIGIIKTDIGVFQTDIGIFQRIFQAHIGKDVAHNLPAALCLLS